MQKIHFLDPQEAQKIAAGEVIERPMGVVKECIENSIDAQARSITLYIENVGKTLIKIIDDGVGMNQGDLSRSVAPFATSKISKLDDLETLASFGFRGEALASIASISKVTIRSKERTSGAETLGNQIVVHAGILLKESSVAMSAGTEVVIEDLFYNTPVRKKFLRATETEWNGIVSTFHAFCLSHLTISFMLFKDGKESICAPAVKTLEERIGQLWGVDLADKMIPVSYVHQGDEISISGIISNQQVYRYNRQQVIYFINGRLVKNSSMSKAIVKGYTLSLPDGKFPIAVLLLQINCKSIDVNIHPRKEEVRFVRPGVVDTALSNAVQHALEVDNSKRLTQTALRQSNQAHSGYPFSSMPQPRFQNQSFESRPFDRNQSDLVVDPFKKIFDQRPLTDFFKRDSVITFSSQAESISEVDPLFLPKREFKIEPKEKPEPIEIVASQVDRSTTKNQPEVKSILLDDLFIPQIIGVLYQTYILLESEDGLLCVDQHAAHERILYERWKGKFEKKEGSQLLFPHTFSLPEQERTFILSMQSFFLDQGFEIEPFGKTNLIIQTAPPHINGVDIVECIKEIAGKFVDQQMLSISELRIKLNEHMHSHLACKAAVKAGDALSVEAQRALIKDLFLTPNRHQCIHGRPTIWLIKKSDIFKAFKRPTE